MLSGDKVFLSINPLSVCTIQWKPLCTIPAHQRIVRAQTVNEKTFERLTVDLSNSRLDLQACGVFWNSCSSFSAAICDESTVLPYKQDMSCILQYLQDSVHSPVEQSPCSDTQHTLQTQKKQVPIQRENNPEPTVSLRSKSRSRGDEYPCLDQSFPKISFGL